MDIMDVQLCTTIYARPEALMGCDGLRFQSLVCCRIAECSDY